MLEKLKRSGEFAVYCDDEAFYKPDYSPQTLETFNYIGFYMIVEDCADFSAMRTRLNNFRAAHLALPLTKNDKFEECTAPDKDTPDGKVSIIIPSKDNYAVLKRCIDSIRQKSTYNNYEIIVVDNGSQSPEKYKMLADIYIYEKCEFNFSYMCNIGAKNAEGDFLLFLNDDTEVITPSWLENMMKYAADSRVGAVGAKLYYPNSTIIQHCGVINLQPGPAHALLGMDDKEVYYHGINRGCRNFSAVTAACMMLERETFDKLNGFDESLAVAYNDVELCFRLLKNNRYNCVDNDTKLYHYESLSRGDDRLSAKKLKRLGEERAHLFDLHPDMCGKDPYYNPHLTPYRADYQERSFFKHTIKAAKPVDKSGDMTYKIEYAISDDMVMIGGYAFDKGASKVYIQLGDYLIDTKCEMRTDIDAMYGKDGLLSGFSLVLCNTALPKGRYRIGIVLKNSFGVIKKTVQTDNYVEFL
jgi:GT2 family glycosyltransferase